MTNDMHEELRLAVERAHGGTATFVQSVQVNETFEGKPVWQGVVHVFDLTGHPLAKRVYACSAGSLPAGGSASDNS